jgi:hypothetical protein
MRYVIRLIAIVCCSLAALHLGPANAEKRVALIIGNASCSSIGGPRNGPNDAAAMAALLKAAEFDKVEARDSLRMVELRPALREFAGETAANADVGELRNSPQTGWTRGRGAMASNQSCG